MSSTVTVAREPELIWQCVTAPAVFRDMTESLERNCLVLSREVKGIGCISLPGGQRGQVADRCSNVHTVPDRRRRFRERRRRRAAPGQHDAPQAPLRYTIVGCIEFLRLPDHVPELCQPGTQFGQNRRKALSRQARYVFEEDETRYKLSREGHCGKDQLRAFVFGRAPILLAERLAR
jgi:hypothetical protein